MIQNKTEPILRHYSRILAINKLYELDFNNLLDSEVDLSNFPSITEIESLVDENDLKDLKAEADNGDKDAKFLYKKDTDSQKLILSNREELDYYAKYLVTGTLDNREEIDATISQYSVNRPINRINIIDRNILRVSIFTLLFNKETHTSIVIDEAVKISRSLSTNVTYKFINGILDSIAKSLNDKDNK